MLSTFGLFALGFVLYSWWTPLVAFVGASLIAGLAVTHSNAGLFYLATPVTGLISVALCAYGWYQWAVA